MKNYTYHYDSGYTHLYTGQCVEKSSPIVEALGAVDELNSLLGMAFSQLKDVELREIIKTIQGDLLTIGADLASPIKRQRALDSKHTEQLARIKELTNSEVKYMEHLIQRFEKELPPLRNFILPSGTPGHQLSARCASAHHFVPPRVSHLLGLVGRRHLLP